MDNDKLIFGIDTHPDPKEHSNVWELLKLPFLKYRAPVGGKFEQWSGNSGYYLKPHPE